MGDLRAALRGILRRPIYSAVAVAILALGLSAGIGVFTYFNGFHQPFPGVDAHRLVQVFDATDEDPYANLSYLDYVDYAAGATGAFEGVAAIQSGYAASIRHDASTEVLTQAIVRYAIDRIRLDQCRRPRGRLCPGRRDILCRR